VSGYDPGRPSKESREVEYLVTGDQILDEHGLERTVVAIEPAGHHLAKLTTVRSHGDSTIRETFELAWGTQLKTRVRPEDR
jgi:hypothetical protein